MWRGPQPCTVVSETLDVWLVSVGAVVNSHDPRHIVPIVSLVAGTYFNPSRCFIDSPALIVTETVW